MSRAAPRRPRPAIVRSLPVLVVLLAALLIAGRGSRPRAAAQDQASVTYHAGWNIVAVPTGSLIGKVNGPVYTLGPGADGYDAIAPEQLLGGRAAWVYFPQDTTITLGRSAAEYSRVLVQANEFVLGGNPSGSEAVAISGPGVTAFTYDPAVGYAQVNELRPGQGAFLIAEQDGPITLGKAPAGQSTDDLTRVQVAVTANPTDRSTYDQLTKITADLVGSHNYAQVQTAIDDISAAADDGFRKQGAGVPPPLDSVQRDSEVGVRNAVATAKADAAAGNVGGADAAIDQARTAAQQGLTDGLAVGRSSALHALLAFAQASPAGLSRARALARAGLPLAGLGRPLPDLFFGTLTALANGSALPAGPTPTPAPTIRFSGNVTVNGLPGANSTVVATVNGTSCGSGPIAADGSYTLDIQSTAACTMPGATVQFSIGGEVATPTGTIPPAPGPVRLDLAITTVHGSGQPGQATPSAAQPSNAALPFGSCQSGQIGLQFLTEAENPPGVINDVFRFQVLGLAPGTSFALYVAPVLSSGQTDQFVATARQAAGGVADAQGQATGTLTLTTPHPANAPPIHTQYALELVAGNSCFDGFASVPQLSNGSITPSSPTPCPASSMPESAWTAGPRANTCP